MSKSTRESRKEEISSSLNRIRSDIPGLIEGAHEGKGLGTQFLRHIERTAVLLFLIDAQSLDPEHDLMILRSELGQHSPHLLEKPWLVRITKGDILGPDLVAEIQQSPFAKANSATVISAVSGLGTKELSIVCKLMVRITLSGRSAIAEIP